MSTPQVNLSWDDYFGFLVGSILSFADPITDFLTLLEFYRVGHKVWFSISLLFLILPCFAFAFLKMYSRGNCGQAIICGLHPFGAAFARLRGFLLLMKPNSDDSDQILNDIESVTFYEAVLESAPQCVIQLYAINMQAEPVASIQIISLLVSLLSLAWTFANADKMLHGSVIANLRAKHRAGLFVVNVFHLSSRLLAVCIFTFKFKWWVMAFLISHALVIEAVSVTWLGQKCNCTFKFGKAILTLLKFCTHWLRDDVSSHEELYELRNRSHMKAIILVSNVLYVIENFVMIFFHYRNNHSNIWFSLPVTVVVCSFSVLGAILRVIVFRSLLKENAVNPETLNSDNTDVNNNSLNNSIGFYHGH